MRSVRQRRGTRPSGRTWAPAGTDVDYAIANIRAAIASLEEHIGRTNGDSAPPARAKFADRGGRTSGECA